MAVRCAFCVGTLRTRAAAGELRTEVSWGCAYSTILRWRAREFKSRARIDMSCMDVGHFLAAVRGGQFVTAIGRW